MTELVHRPVRRHVFWSAVHWPAFQMFQIVWNWKIRQHSETEPNPIFESAFFMQNRTLQVQCGTEQCSWSQSAFVVCVIKFSKRSCRSSHWNRSGFSNLTQFEMNELQDDLVDGMGLSQNSAEFSSDSGNFAIGSIDQGESSSVRPGPYCHNHRRSYPPSSRAYTRVTSVRHF